MFASSSTVERNSFSMSTDSHVAETEETFELLLAEYVAHTWTHEQRIDNVGSNPIPNDKQWRVPGNRCDGEIAVVGDLEGAFENDAQNRSQRASEQVKVLGDALIAIK